uniref:ABC-type glutathione-S-conjugate transporter n=1 Tax=Myripristis murdjan TaxID=586833 RepID=A0A667YL76_9TELE
YNHYLFTNCGSNSPFTSFTLEPDLPVCVEQTVLVWIPLGLLWLCAPWHLASLFRRQAKVKHLSKLYFCKQVTDAGGKVNNLATKHINQEDNEEGDIEVKFYREASFNLCFILTFVNMFILVHLSSLSSMVIKGYKRPLVQEDLWDLNEADSTGYINQLFQSTMQSELHAARIRFQNSLKKPACRNRDSVQEEGIQNGLSNDTGCNALAVTGLSDDLSFELSCKLHFFFFSRMMVSFADDKSIYTWKGYIYALLLLVVAILQSLCLQQYFQRCFVLGMKVRTAIMAAVYKKSLVVSNDARKESTVGETVNLMSADAQRFNDVTNFIHLLWSCPLQIALAIVFLWFELGPSVLAGLAVMVLMVPVNGLLATKARNIQIENMKFKDRRMKIMNEILNGIKVSILKLYAWELSFQKQVGDIREDELKVMRNFAYLTSVSTFIFTCAPALVSLVSFAVFVGVSPDNILNAEKAFTAISLFNILRFPLAMLPMLIAAMVQKGSFSLSICLHLRPCVSIDTAVSVCDGTFAWERDAEAVLKNVSLDIKPGRLVAVVGAVGSGKSSLMSALLGEMHNTKGFVNIQGSLAFVPQQAWIQNATLKDNILFGSPYEERQFQEVIQACALAPDLELLGAGELTEIGEKGINLSGGQKQRVSLARAAYSQSDIYLLDDPLSAVDSHVGKHLFSEVIGPNGLLKDKTRILVTHGVSFLPYVDEIVVLVDGVVSEIGTYQSLRASRGAFSEFLDTYAQDKEIKSNLSHLFHMCNLSWPSFKGIGRVGGSQKGPGQAWGEKQRVKVDMTKCAVKLSVYLQYLRAMGWGYSTMAILVYIMQSVAFTFQNIWLSEWTNDAKEYYNQTYPTWKRDTRVGVFGALGVAQGIFVFIASLLLANGAVAASRILHSRLLNNILRAPMVFFDTTPTGRVVNRFAKVEIIISIPQSLKSWLLCLIGVLATLFVICLATPLFTIIIIPLAVVYYFVQCFYVATSRQLRRLDSVSRSPIYSHFGETVSGLSVIRAYGHQERFLKHNEVTIDENLKSVYPWIVSNRWLAIRLEFLGNLVVFFSSLFAVISRNSLNSGLVGLSISYALNVTQTLNWLVRMTSELETNIVAVERVSEYTEIESEAEWVTDIQPPEQWPDAGRLQFENYKVRYRPELDLVLHGITCDIDTTEKIGIVGRTGAGKSSLTNCLFRIIEAAEGRIFIDGVDISTIGLHHLRGRLTIIPQDPVLFSGSLRLNLDPFETFSDEEIWRALELSHLKDYVSGLQEGLQHEVTEGGENLSVGQRQLLCLARALLRKSRILILDEATAAVDLETDNLIQTTIRKEFSHCTVLTIAHRLHSIMDSSRVMVLSAGKIVEFDSPSNLIEKQGHFYAMAKDAGITAVDCTAL